jgi:GTPase
MPSSVVVLKIWMFKNHRFSTISNQVNPSLKNTILRLTTTLATTRTTTSDEVIQIIKKLPNKKVRGEEEIPNMYIHNN